MKKLFIIIASTILFSCSKDDNDSNSNCGRVIEATAETIPRNGGLALRWHLKYNVNGTIRTASVDSNVGGQPYYIGDTYCP